MSNPNPLIPQGTFQAQAAKGASNVRLAVATIVAIHVVFFGGLLLQGCKRDTQVAENTDAQAQTNTEPSTNLALPPLDSSSLYYTNPNALPADNRIAGVSTAAPGSEGFTQSTGAGTTPEAMWQTTNLSSPLGAASQASGATREYTVVSGDSLSRIAVRQKTTLSALRAANPNVDPARIKAGDKLTIPEAAPQRASASASGSNAAAGAGNTYMVKAGDNLTRIARDHGVTVSQLRAANNLKTSRVTVGQKLKIPAAKPAKASNGGTSTQP
jgi:LysM repeat protein